MNGEREKGLTGQVGMQQAALQQAGGAAQTVPGKAGHMETHLQQLCQFRDRLRDCNNGMRDISVRITGNNPIPVEPKEEAPSPEGLLHAILAVMNEIEYLLQDYNKVVQHLNSL